MNKIRNIIDKLYYDRRKVGIISFLLIFGISVLYFYSNEQKEEPKIEITKKEEVKEEKKVKQTKVIVDIKGEVNNPGCYEVEDNLRVKDVIALAGGITPDADTSNINLSTKVHDEMVIVIEKKGTQTEKIESEAKVTTNTKTSTTSKTTGKISINKADQKTLMTLTGIGESKAKKIIEYRNANGPFTKLEDIKKVNGTGDAIFAKIKDSITL
jgi:competence protein ComEA